MTSTEMLPPPLGKDCQKLARAVVGACALLGRRHLSHPTQRNAVTPAYASVLRTRDLAHLPSAVRKSTRADVLRASSRRINSRHPTSMFVASLCICLHHRPLALTLPRIGVCIFKVSVTAIELLPVSGNAVIAGWRIFQLSDDEILERHFH